MATLIDSLVVALGLDASGFTKGSKDASVALKKTSDEATRTAKELEARGKQAAQFFAQIKTQVVGLFGVFTAGKGLSSFVSDVVAGDAAVGRLAKNVGMSTDSLSAWQGVAERAGGSAAGISGSIQHISSEMQKLALTGTTDMIPFLTLAHVNLQKFLSTTTPMSEKLLELSDSFQKMTPQKAQAIGQGMGLDQGTINVLMQGRTAVEALLAEQQKIGVANQADAESAQRLQTAWRALGEASSDLGRKILTSLSPYIQMLGAALLKLSEWAATHRPMVEAMFIGLAAAVTAFAVVLAAPIAGMAALSAGIGVAVAAIAVLYDDWKTWIDGGQSAFGGFWQFFADAWNSVSSIVGPAFEYLGKLLGDYLDDARDVLKLLAGLFFGSADDIRHAWSALGDDIRKQTEDWVNFFDKGVQAILGLNNLIAKAIVAAFAGAFDYVEGRAKVIWDLITGKHGTAPPSGGNGSARATQSGGAGNSALADLISKGEGDYNSVNRGAAGGYKAGTEDLANMTVSQVMAAQKAGKFNAAGRYQVIGSTLAGAVKALGLKGDEKFDQGTQDKIFQQYLISNKRKAIGDYVNGKSNDIGAAIKAASLEWASVADPATGKSHYAGVGNNKASISVADMTRALQMARSNANGGPTSTTSNDVKIGQVIVQTKATDAAGIAKDIGPAMQKYSFTAQANAGLS